MASIQGSGNESNNICATIYLNVDDSIFSYLFVFYTQILLCLFNFLHVYEK